MEEVVQEVAGCIVNEDDIDQPGHEPFLVVGNVSQEYLFGFTGAGQGAGKSLEPLILVLPGLRFRKFYFIRFIKKPTGSIFRVNPDQLADQSRDFEALLHQYRDHAGADDLCDHSSAFLVEEFYFISNLEIHNGGAKVLINWSQSHRVTESHGHQVTRSPVSWRQYIAI